MRTLPAFSGRTRWAVPAGAVTAVAAVAIGSAITVAQAAPSLPARTPAQLLAELAGQTSLPPPLTGTVVETAAFGLPQLPGVANTSSITSLLAGSHTVKIWYKDPAHLRLAIPVRMGETDFIRNGNTSWLWQSSTNSATEFVSSYHGHARHPVPVPSPISLTPQQAARRILAAVGPTTKVSTESNVTIARQAAYELVISPRDSRSLIDRVTIAVDGQHPNVPLRVQVFTRGATRPAFQVGYTSISFVTPAAANFTFRPPAGAKVQRVPLPGPGFAPLPPYGARFRSPPARCVVSTSPGSASSGQTRERLNCEVIKGPARAVSIPRNVPFRHSVEPGVGCVVYPPGNVKFAPHRVKLVRPAAPMPGRPGEQIRARCAPPVPPHVYGRGWLSVLVLPAGMPPGFMDMGNLAGAAGEVTQSLAGRGVGPGFGAILGALMQSARPVHGAWGSGKLIRTSLFSVLITNDGRILVGAVTPQVLYAAAAQAR